MMPTMTFEEWIKENFDACLDEYIADRYPGCKWDMICEIIEATTKRALQNKGCSPDKVMIDVMMMFFVDHDQPKYQEFCNKIYT